MVPQQNLLVKSLGERRVPSPLSPDAPSHRRKNHVICASARGRLEVRVETEPSRTDDLSFEEAGPREMISFEPSRTTAAIVTCDALFPRLNNVFASHQAFLTNGALANIGDAALANVDEFAKGTRAADLTNAVTAEAGVA